MAKKTDIEIKASEGLSLKSRIDRLTEELAEISEFFREEAGGDTFNFEVKNEGKISVSKPSAGSSKTVLVLNPAAITEKHKAYLMEQGILTEETKTSKGRAASVTYKPNV